MEEINNTPINNVSETSSWLSDLEIDECNIFPEECNLNFLDADEKEEFLSHDIATVFQEQTQQQCLTSESTLNNSFTDETNFDSFDFDFEIERPTKQLKTIDQSENIIETLSTKLSPSSSNSSFQSLILSFDNPGNSPHTTNTPQIHGFTPTLNSKQNETVSVFPPQSGNMNVSTQIPKGSSKNQNLETKTSQNKRSRAHGHDHIMAERKRREILGQSFIALAALVPNLKKMDKASVLTDSIKYMKELKQRLEVLEEQNKKTKAESVVVINKQDLCISDDNSSCDESIEGADVDANESVLQVEARVSGKEMLIRIHCKKHKGFLVKIMAEIQSFELFVVNSSVLPFGNSILNITIIAQVGEGYNLSIKELVRKLRMATSPDECDAFVIMLQRTVFQKIEVDSV
ncbi:transcription factor bHLH25-like protein [Trifolium pratense]|uniref:Transcription factor bHLH25-like protein n=1 Tax=Trifolium pratense TaxID=57577 RepID=A0A2K3N2G9_TRIPR|nr:transcription factor bHLH25-like protein [Trifolium pratense]